MIGYIGKKVNTFRESFNHDDLGKISRLMRAGKDHDAIDLIGRRHFEGKSLNMTFLTWILDENLPPLQKLPIVVEILRCTNGSTKLDGTSGVTLLKKACLSDSIVRNERVSLLLNAGADPNEIDDIGQSVLHYVAAINLPEIDSPAIVQLFIDHNNKLSAGEYVGIPANFDLINEKMGSTPLSNACLNGKTEVARLLLENGALVNRQDRYNMDTPFLLACGNGNVELVKLLLERGASPAAIQYKGANALHLAAWGGHKEIVELILNLKHPDIHINAKDALNHTPLAYAEGSGRNYQDIANLLKQHGATL